MELIDSYKTLCAEFYDLDKPVVPEDALEYYLSEAGNSVQPVLEPMCGTGRFLIPFMEQGINIEGTDASAEMLKRCESKCRERDLNPVLYYQSLQELTLPEKYGMVFIPAGSFGLIIEDIDIKESLNRVRSVLIPNGKLFIEVETLPTGDLSAAANKREAVRNGNSKIELTLKFQYDTGSNIQTIECFYQNLEHGKLTHSESETIKTRHYNKEEFTELLRTAGFSKIEALRPYTKESASDKDEMILFSCS